MKIFKNKELKRKLKSINYVIKTKKNKFWSKNHSDQMNRMIKAK